MKGAGIRGVVTRLSWSFLMLFPLTGHAAGEEKVNGYKKHRFGISPSKLRDQKPCSLAKERQEESGLVTISCPDLEWGVMKVQATFGFVKEKLRLVTITIPKEKSGGVVDVLGEKYGVPSRSSTENEFRLAETPGNSAEVCFAEDTLCAVTTWNGKTPVLEIRYAASNLEELLQEYRKSRLMADL